MTTTGGYKYQIKGCAGQGGFAQVFKAYVDNNPDDVVALKVIKASIPDFYLWGLGSGSILLGTFLIFQYVTDSKATFSLGILHVSPTWHADFRKRGLWLLDYDIYIEICWSWSCAHSASSFFRGWILALLTDCTSILTTAFWSLII